MPCLSRKPHPDADPRTACHPDGVFGKDNLKNTQILTCPSTSNLPLGYGWNYQNFGYDYSNHGTGWARVIATVDMPAETILIGDNPDPGMLGESIRYIYGPTQYPPPADGIGNVSGRHNGGGNYGFCDGHAKWLSRSDAAGNDDLWDVP